MYNTNGSVKIDPKSGLPVRKMFLSHDVVAVKLLDDTVKIVKNRFGASGQTIPTYAFEKAFSDMTKVWLLDWQDAVELLKGICSV